MSERKLTGRFTNVTKAILRRNVIPGYSLSAIPDDDGVNSHTSLNQGASLRERKTVHSQGVGRHSEHRREGRGLQWHIPSEREKLWTRVHLSPHPLDAEGGGMYARQQQRNNG